MAIASEPAREPSFRYAAFISYRHVEPDRKWAKWLHRALETYRVPRGLQESHGLPARVGRVFRDEEELSASSDLSREIEAALRASSHLIVVCSPRTPASEWVNQEVVRFREMGRGDRILALLIEGEPGESFPASLREIREAAVEEGGQAVETVEPLAADVRPAAHESAGHLRHFAKLRLLSSVMGCRFDDLRRREQQRQRKRAGAWTSSLLSLVVLLAGLTSFAFVKQKEAEDNATTARTERDAKTEALKEKSHALERVLRLSDSKVARDLVSEADALWPVRSDRAQAMADWIRRSRVLLAGREDHLAARAALEASATTDSVVEDRRRRREAKDRLPRVEARQAELRGEQVVLEARASEIQEEPAVPAEIDASQERNEELQAELDRLHEALAEIEGDLERLLSERTELERFLAGPPLWRFEGTEDAWRFQVLNDLLADLDRLSPVNGPGGMVAEVEERHEAASTLRTRSVEGHRETWEETIAEIAASPNYGGLRIVAQAGLVPLGADPDSGLYEFAHCGSGAIPHRDPETHRLTCADDAAIVLVLIPGGVSRMGAQRQYSDGPNYDEEAQNDESDNRWLPVDVTITPFFLAKYECTQAQWKAMTRGESPSLHKAGAVVGGKQLTQRNPVEQIAWEDADLWLRRHRLRLPTEAQWEWACRGGRDTPWFPGRVARALNGYANIADKYCKENTGPDSWTYTIEVDDGHVVHASVGCFAANAFGLHDVHGNVSEWCWDLYDSGYYGTLAEGQTADRTDPQGPRGDASGRRVYRGGSWNAPAAYARCANRLRGAPGGRLSSLGVRPSRSITSD